MRNHVAERVLHSFLDTSIIALIVTPSSV